MKMNKKVIGLVLAGMLSFGVVGCGSDEVEVQEPQVQQEESIQEEPKTVEKEEIKEGEIYTLGYNYWINIKKEEINKSDYLVMIFHLVSNMQYHNNNNNDLSVSSWNDDYKIDPYIVKSENVREYCWGQLQFLIDLVEEYNDEETLNFLKEVENNFDKNLWDEYNVKIGEMYNKSKEIINREEKDVVEEKKEVKSDVVTIGMKNALGKAETYLNIMDFSKEGLKDQLEYDEYTDEEINYALENVEVNWSEECEGKAETYLNIMNFSKEGLKDQLEYDGYTSEQINYAIEKVWN